MDKGVRTPTLASGGKVSIFSSLGAGFALCVRRPVSMITWGFLGGCWMVLVTSMVPHKPPRAHFDPATVDTSLLWFALSMGIYALPLCAAYRAILRPEKRSFAYMRVGLAEVAVAVTIIAWMFGGVALPVAGVASAVVAAGALQSHQPLIELTGLILGLAALLVPMASVWCLLRFSLLGPMAVDLGRVPLRDAWRASKGHVRALFAMAGCLWVIGGIWLALSIVSLGVLGLFGPNFVAVLCSIVVIAVGPGVAIAVMAAPWARAYRNLADPDVASVFE